MASALSCISPTKAGQLQKNREARPNKQLEIIMQENLFELQSHAPTISIEN